MGTTKHIYCDCSPGLYSASRFGVEHLPGRKRCGFSTTELFVVLMIIAIILSLLLPAVQSVRERARELVCKNNIHQINLAVAQFNQVHKQLPMPPSFGHASGWAVEILPFIEQKQLGQSIPSGRPVGELSTDLLVPPKIYRCPHRTTLDATPPDALWPGHYVLVPTADRKSFYLFDAPVEWNVPWVTGLESTYTAVTNERGPHSDGFFFSRGLQQGVALMIDGKEVR